MNSRLLTTGILLVASIVTSACTPNDTTMGGAFRHNVIAQTIDPDPDYEGTKIEGGDGVRAAAATDRYHKGTVKEPAVLTTTSGAQGGSGSGSGSGPR